MQPLRPLQNLIFLIVVKNKFLKFQLVIFLKFVNLGVLQRSQFAQKCLPDVYIKLNNDIHNAKALAGQLGGCKNGMSIYEIKQRMMAWKGLAIARSRREKQCWEGGNSGHGQAITQAWNTYTNCKNLLP